MGTNYYAYEDTCPCCNRGINEIYIGKSSAGWHFALHVIPEKGLNNLEDWREFLLRGNVSIKDEYDRIISVEELFNIIENRKSERDIENIPFGYDSWDHFHRLNQSIFGINGLIRAKISNFCIGHGEGTYDYFKGDFS